MTEFSTLGLAEPVLKALAAKKYVNATPIQTQAIPALLEGRDLCGIAQTGTGKTAAFALPALHYLHNTPKARVSRGCRVLVLSPTRELAAQIAQSFRDYGRFLPFTVEAVFGGVPINRQIQKLREGADIVVATPGRLIDLVDQRALSLADVEIFVLDEADQMMDLGFIHALKRITKMLPKKRQSLFFSATMPKTIKELSAQFITDPVTVEVAPQSTTAERVKQYATFVNQKEKQALLTLTLKAETIDRALIFTRTKHGADRVVRHLTSAGIQSMAIHGNKSQSQRTTALQAFRSGQIKLLVATDIAARGIDVPGVSHVFNFELPNVAEQYVHRIGRTARAGADGISISFVDDEERPYLRAIEKATRMKCEMVPLPEDFLAQASKLPAPAAVERGPRPERKDGGKPRHGAKQGRGEARGGGGGGDNRQPAADGENRARRPRRSGAGASVGTHKGAVQRTGGGRPGR
ncbi:MAG TPA: DEAD/DEAH box helicase [Sphingobium sp.]|uniref:DEAD/DEAH box helicase n=1 Tax=Sphingobium sp. TaxID=1912891 RepID=UPI002ED1C224